MFVRLTTNEVSATGGRTAISGVATIGAGVNIGYAVKADGTTWAWGRNSTGRLGDGTHTDRYTPVQVSGLTNARAIAGGSNLSYVVDTDGHLWRRGATTSGQVSYPRQVPSLAHITAIASAPGTSGSGAGVQGPEGKVWRYDRPTGSFTPVYGLTGVTAIGSVGQIGYAAAS